MIKKLFIKKLVIIKLIFNFENKYIKIFLYLNYLFYIIIIVLFFRHKFY